VTTFTSTFGLLTLVIY